MKAKNRKGRDQSIAALQHGGHAAAPTTTDGHLRLRHLRSPRVAVELRVWDGGEPGKGTDIVYVKLGNTVLLNANGQYIDQGNMQYHANCRGPK